jgi:hypothetical protein
MYASKGVHMKVKGLITMVVCCSLGALAAQSALAQNAPPPGLDVPAPLPPGTTKAGAPVPDWLVWRVFHDSMRFYGKQSPDAVKRLLTEKAALTPDQADAVLKAGPGYLQAMSSIDAAAQSEIQQRYRSADLPSSTRNIPRPAFRKGAVPPSGPPVEWGGNLRDQLEEDGLVARVNRQKADTLAAHRRALSASLGPDALTALESWLATNVAPGVKVFDKATRTAAPTRSSQGR